MMRHKLKMLWWSINKDDTSDDEVEEELKLNNNNMKVVDSGEESKDNVNKAELAEELLLRKRTERIQKKEQWK